MNQLFQRKGHKLPQGGACEQELGREGIQAMEGAQEALVLVGEEESAIQCPTTTLILEKKKKKG